METKNSIIHAIELIEAHFAAAGAKIKLSQFYVVTFYRDATELKLQGDFKHETAREVRKLCDMTVNDSGYAVGEFNITEEVIVEVGSTETQTRTIAVDITLT